MHQVEVPGSTPLLTGQEQQSDDESGRTASVPQPDPCVPISSSFRSWDIWSKEIGREGE